MDEVTMYSVINEDSPEFKKVNKAVNQTRQRIDFERVVNDFYQVRATGGHIKFSYSHDQISNVVGALKRRGLVKDRDYRVTRVKNKSSSSDALDEIIISPL